MESKVVEGMLLGEKSSFPADDGEHDRAMALSASPAAFFFAFLAPPLSLLRHVACLCAGYLGLDGGGLKPPASSSAACQRDEVEVAASEDCTEEVVVLQVRSRGFTAPQPRSTPREASIGAVGGAIH